MTWVPMKQPPDTYPEVVKLVLCDCEWWCLHPATPSSHQQGPRPSKAREVGSGVVATGPGMRDWGSPVFSAPQLMMCWKSHLTIDTGAR